MVAQNVRDGCGWLLVVGVLAMVVFQVVNISMTIGMPPITGILLPWLSYALSALLTNLIALGMVELVANFCHRLTFTDWVRFQVS